MRYAVLYEREDPFAGDSIFFPMDLSPENGVIPYHGQTIRVLVERWIQDQKKWGLPNAMTPGTQQVGGAWIVEEKVLCAIQGVARDVIEEFGADNSQRGINLAPHYRCFLNRVVKIAIDRFKIKELPYSGYVSVQYKRFVTRQEDEGHRACYSGNWMHTTVFSRTREEAIGRLVLDMQQDGARFAVTYDADARTVDSDLQDADDLQAFLDWIEHEGKRVGESCEEAWV